jgi:CRISPR/Cas system-associated exonuclease Cas4 (RecB family)
LALGRELNAETLFKVFCIRYEREPQDQITYGSKDRDSIYATARKLLELLVHQVERPHKIVAIERSISYALTPDLTIVGRPDLIARDASGRLVLTDVKSTARSYGPDDIRRVTEQCWFYALAMDEAITLRCLLLLKKKTPEIQEIRLSPDDVDYDEMVQKAVGVKASIEAGIHFRVRSWACAGCGFRQFCDAKDGELAESYNQRRAA